MCTVVLYVGSLHETQSQQLAALGLAGDQDGAATATSSKAIPGLVITTTRAGMAEALQRVCSESGPPMEAPPPPPTLKQRAKRATIGAY